MTTLERTTGRAGRPPIRHVVGQDTEIETEADELADVPRRPASFRREDGIALAGSAASAVGLMWLLFFRILPIGSVVGFAICSYVGFLFVYWLAERDLNGRLAARDRVMAAIVTTAGLAMIVPLVTILASVAIKGIELLRPSFFVNTMEAVGPLDEGGGALHAIVGTILQVGLATLISVPLGLGCAVFLNEIRGPLAKPVRTVVNAMSGVPSIVAGLFVFALWIMRFGQGFSGLAAAIALSVLMLPSVTRASEEVLRLVPGGLRESSLALGSPEWRSTWHVVLPTARTGVVTAIILGMARVLGETAPLIMTSFGVGATTLNANPFSGPQNSLPLYTYTLHQSPSPLQVSRSWTGALVLVILVLVLFGLARWLGGKSPGAGRARRDARRNRQAAGAAPVNAVGRLPEPDMRPGGRQERPDDHGDAPPARGRDTT